MRFISKIDLVPLTTACLFGMYFFYKFNCLNTLRFVLISWIEKNESTNLKLKLF